MAPDTAGAAHGLSGIWNTEREGPGEAEGWGGGRVGAEMLPALGLCVGYAGLGWALGWEVLREKLLLQQLRWRRKWGAGGSLA